MDINKLIAPFPVEKIKWRVGSTTKDKKKGMALAYVDARDIMQRLDDVVGWDEWSDRYEYHGNTCVCYLTIGKTTKADGSAETAVEGEKGQISKALVRAAVKFGIGRYLYDTPTVWVELDEYKKIKKEEYSKLNRAIGKVPVELTKVFKDTVDGITDLEFLAEEGKKDRPEEEKAYIRKRYAQLKKEINNG
jgi:hypothetical protein